MRFIELVRMETSEEGTFGIMKIDKKIFCITLEPPNKQNLSNISSIPTGQYIIKPYSSAKFPEVYQVIDVPERTNVLFHKGNTVGHTAGCIILGQTVGKLKGDRAILNSGATFGRFKDLLKGNTHHLTITENY